MGFMGLNFPVIDSGSALTTIDSYVTTNTNGNNSLTNGAMNTPGGIYMTQPSPATISTNGVGSPRFLKYVRYNPTASQAILAGPAIVYWKDETFTVVTGLLSESFGGASGINNVAGWLLPNTTSVPSLSTATNINGNWCFIHIGGFLPNAAPTACTVGDSIYGATGAFTTGHTATATASPQRVAAYALTTLASGLADLYVPFLN